MQVPFDKSWANAHKLVDRWVSLLEKVHRTVRHGTLRAFSKSRKVALDHPVCYDALAIVKFDHSEA